MYAIGDLVQPKSGGPKLKIIAVEGDSLVVVQASDEQGQKYTLKAVEVSPYSEDGDFGVC